MSYKNSFKLLTSNFSLVWKQLAYMITLCLLMFALSYGFAIPTLNLLEKNNVIKEISLIFETIYTAPKEVVTAISNTFIHLTEVISSNFGKIWFSLLSTTILVHLLYQWFKNVSFYNLASLMHYHMTSFVEIGYTRNLISNLKPGAKYAFAKTILQIPFTLAKLTIIYAYFKIAVSPIGILIGLFITSSAIILLSSLELTLFTGMTGVFFENEDINPFKAFFKGNTTIFKKFPRVFSNSIITTLTIIVINIFLGIFTLGSGLLITLPASMVFIAIFELSSYLGVKGERYYLSKTIIATPLKDEENEKINNIK